MIRRRVGVDDDIAETAIDLLDEANETAAIRYLDAVERTLKELALAPGIGSRKPFSDPALANIRSWWVKGFPKHIIYYVPLLHGIDVFAVWHGTRHIEGQLAAQARSE